MSILPRTFRTIAFVLALSQVAVASPSGVVTREPSSIPWFISDPVMVERSIEDVYRIHRPRHGTGSSMVWTELPLSVGGKSVLRFSVDIRTALIDGGAVFAMNALEDGDSVSFVTLAGREPDGTTPWTTYTLEMTPPAGADQLRAFFWLHGEGEAWFRNPTLTIDGRLLTASAGDEPRVEAASGVSTALATPGRAAHLAFAMRVWGFAKYHNPAYTMFARDADKDFFDLVNAILADASDDPAGAALQWLDALPDREPEAMAVGPAAPGDTTVDWIEGDTDTRVRLRQRLRGDAFNQIRRAVQGQVSLSPDSGEPVFERERSDIVDPQDVGYRLLAVARAWNAIQYWYAYRAELGVAWDDILESAVRNTLHATNARDAALALQRMLAIIPDSHVVLEHPALSKERACRVPVALRIVDDLPVVLRSITPLLRPGDRIEKIAGRPVRGLIDGLVHRLAASTPQARRVAIADALVESPCGARIDIGFERDGEHHSKAIPVDRVRLPNTPDLPAWTRHGDSIHVNVAELRAADVADVVKAASSADGLVIDLRGYPRDMLVQALGGHLVATPTPLARFKQAGLGRPGEFRRTATTAIEPSRPLVDLPVAILIDETTISRGEYHAMAFRHARRAVTIGQRTAGANGDVSSLPLPDGGVVRFTGVRVTHPDGSALQAVGLPPDIEVDVTRPDIARGRDPVLRRGLDWVASQRANR